METWTEYGWQNVNTCEIEQAGRNSALHKVRACTTADERIVGRTVAASDWLPVDNGGKS